MSPAYLSPLKPLRRRSFRPYRKIRQTRAFTMIEALFACSILIFGFVPVLGVMLLSLRVEQQGYTRAVAYNVARYEMELLQQRAWQNLPVTGDTTFTVPTSLTAQLPYGVVLVGKYNITTPTVTPATTLTNLRQITVSVSWVNTVNHVGPAYRSNPAAVAQSSSAPSAEVRLTTLVAQQQYQSGS